MSATAPDDITTRVALLEQASRETRDTLGRIEQSFERRFDKMDARFDKVDARFDRMDARFDRMDGRIDALGRDARTDFRLLITLGVGGFAGLLGAIAHGFRWL